MTTVDNLLELFRARGNSQYGGERVTQQEHALQAAWAAEKEGAGAELIVAALLHDVGHLLHELPDDAPEQGIDDRHENSGHRWLARLFGPPVVEPVRLHVAAKRYLCTVDPQYEGQLSAPSIQSLHLQGGRMNAAELASFEGHRFWREAVSLRHWDDAAKVPGLATPGLDHFATYLQRSVRESP